MKQNEQDNQQVPSPALKWGGMIAGAVIGLGIGHVTGRGFASFTQNTKMVDACISTGRVMGAAIGASAGKDWADKEASRQPSQETMCR